MLAMATTVKVPTLTPAERAAQLIASGTPKIQAKVSENSEDEDEDEADTYGIVSTNKLKPSTVD